MNRTQRGMLSTGIIMLIVGAVVALVAGSSIAHDSLNDRVGLAVYGIGGLVARDTAWLVVGGVVALVGLVLVIVVVSIRAAQPSRSLSA